MQVQITEAQARADRLKAAVARARRLAQQDRVPAVKAPQMKVAA